MEAKVINLPVHNTSAARDLLLLSVLSYKALDLFCSSNGVSAFKMSPSYKGEMVERKWEE